MRNNYMPVVSSAAEQIKQTLAQASQELGTANPLPFVGGLLERSFPLPLRAPEYAANALTPGAVPLEPSFCETEPDVLRFTIVPLGPGHSAGSRCDEATREMRRLIAPCYGNDALRWFDQRSEEWRGSASRNRLNFGAYFGSAFDEDGLQAAKVYYETDKHQIASLPLSLRMLAETAIEVMPHLVPVFTSIKCGRHSGGQRMTFHHRGPLKLADLARLAEPLGMKHQLPGIMQIVGLSLGGRFDLPERSVLLGLSETAEGPEIKLEILLGMIPDVPPTFLDLLALGLSERPRQLAAMGRWLHAFTPHHRDWPGEFSVLSVRATPRTSARVSLYLRPTDLLIHRRLADVHQLAGSRER